MQRWRLHRGKTGSMDRNSMWCHRRMKGRSRMDNGGGQMYVQNEEMHMQGDEEQKGIVWNAIYAQKKMEKQDGEDGKEKGYEKYGECWEEQNEVKIREREKEELVMPPHFHK
jgi:hypothetical protein